MLKNKSLGKNMARLFNPQEALKITTQLTNDSHYESVKMISLEHIYSSSYQPRTEFDELKIQELAESIKAQGVIQPIILKTDTDGSYMIIAGERRFRAAQQAKLSKIPAIIRDYSDQDASLVALIENIQREDLNPLDKAEAISRLTTNHKLKQQELAEMLGMSRTQLTNTLRLLKLHESVKTALLNKKITEGHAKILAGLNLADQQYYCDQIENHYLSVRQLEETIARDSNIEESYEKEQKKKSKATDIFLDKIKQSIEEYLLTKVALSDNGKGKGKIILHYSSYDELDGIISKMGAIKEIL
jgi:ParB family chromosome partitioning protein